MDWCRFLPVSTRPRGRRSTCSAMCPMIPITLLAAFLLALIEFTSSVSASPKLNFEPKHVVLKSGQSLNVSFWTNETIVIPDSGNRSFECEVYSNPTSTLIVDNCQVSQNESKHLVGQFQATGDLLGHATATVEIKSPEPIKDQVDVTILLPKALVQHIFLASVILLISINYVNMGCALDMNIIIQTLRKPIGPAVGMITQYVIMPILSYITATFLLSEPYLQLGLFTFGCSPGGGASNMWTVLLNGNLNLSITMTFLSSIASLAMMPLWLFTVGKTFFGQTIPRIPFSNIIASLLGMIVPLGIGLLMQRFCPKGTAFCKRMLSPFSMMMIVFIIIFGTYANLYMFRLITWEMALAAMANVWTGFAIGIVAARLSGLTWTDSITVMIETGIQNTGVAIVLLGVSLPKPDGDMAAVVPVTASMITPIPLSILWLLMKLVNCRRPTPSMKNINSVTSENVGFLAAEKQPSSPA